MTDAAEYGTDEYWREHHARFEQRRALEPEPLPVLSPNASAADLAVWWSVYGRNEAKRAREQRARALAAATRRYEQEMK